MRVQVYLTRYKRMRITSKMVLQHGDRNHQRIFAISISLDGIHHLSTITKGDLNELVILDVDGFPISWQWFVGHPRGKNLSIVAKTFIDFMYKEGPSLLPEIMK